MRDAQISCGLYSRPPRNECNINTAAQMRGRIIRIGYTLGNTGMHFGPTLSLVEIMLALYCNVIYYQKDDSSWAERDHLILSKGHGALAQYLAMEEAGILGPGQADSFKEDFGLMSAHPSRHPECGIEFASGSLGQGLSLGAGVALAIKQTQNNPARVFVVMGDGELQEGSIWEAVMAAAQFGLNNLVAVVDRNNIQYDGLTESVVGIEPLGEKFQAFGWEVSDVDGHSIEALTNALSVDHMRPLVVIAHTVKGKGISFMEGDPAWHNKALSKAQYEQAIEEIEGAAK